MGAQVSYQDFLDRKAQLGSMGGFDPLWMPDFLFPFQRDLVTWAIRKGRAAIFADCGLGKTPIQLVWAQNVVKKEHKPVLIVTPLAVSHQTIREGQKFGIECGRSTTGAPISDITVTNYERLNLFNPDEFVGIVCDESSILKNFDGARRAIITEFMRTRPYRLCCTATAAPNDYIELGTTSEALGELGYMDMLGRFFRNDNNTSDGKRLWAVHGGGQQKFRFKHHAQEPFWRWVCSWARALRRPSDLGFEDGEFVLPPIYEKETMVENRDRLPGELFVIPALTLNEQRAERRLTIDRRCAVVAEKVNGHEPAVVWCHLNEEGDLLEKLIPDAVQVSGSQEDDEKEERLLSFINRQARVLITKPRIAGFGLNLQFCNHVTFFPSHSFEQYYQCVRRCWRFGQRSPVTVDLVTSPGELRVLQNLQRKAAAADQMFSALVAHMGDALRIDRSRDFQQPIEVPAWLS